MSPSKKASFESSKELKRVFNEHFEVWRKKQRRSLPDLAERCGVSPAYLAHIGRYGRIPSRPVLILLALNFELKDLSSFLAAAGIRDPWPYEPVLRLTEDTAQDSKLLSIRLDMDGFTDAIRGMIRSEIRQRSIHDLLGKRPLRIGFNKTQTWMFDPAAPGAKGFFVEFCDMLGVSLQQEIEGVPMGFSDYARKLASGEIDFFGPIMSAPHSSTGVLFTQPLYKLGVSAVFRTRQTADLENLAAPTDIEELASGNYQIAVVRNSLPHLLANTRLNRSDSSLIICQSDEEAFDRVILKGITKPAHIFVCNAPMAKAFAVSHAKQVKLLFGTRDTLLDLADNSIAVRPDWPEVVPVINEAMNFIVNRGGFRERMKRTISKELIELMEY